MIGYTFRSVEEIRYLKGAEATHVKADSGLGVPANLFNSSDGNLAVIWEAWG